MNFKNLPLFLALSASANAAVVSINFTNNDAPRQIEAAESTGVVNTADWYNLSGTVTATNILGSGIDATASQGSGTSNTARDAAGATNGTNGFLALYEAGLRDNTVAGTPTVTLTGLSSFLTSSSATEYRIIAYYKAPVPSGARGLRIRVGATAGTGSFITANTPMFQNTSASDSFIEHGTADNNWMQFTALTSDTAVIEIQRTNRDGTLAGIQIEALPVPEPSSSALIGLGGLALILRRRV